MKSGWQTLECCQNSTGCGRFEIRRSTAKVLVIYQPLTSEDRGSAYEVKMPKLRFLRVEGVANVQGIGSLPIKRLERRLGVLPKEILDQIKQSHRFALDLE